MCGGVGMLFAHWGILEGMFYSLRLSPQQLSHLPSSGYLSAWTANPDFALCFFDQFLAGFSQGLDFSFSLL